MESVFVCQLCKRKYLKAGFCKKCNEKLAECCHKCEELKEDCAC